MALTKIISGGQTGVDRGALNAAIELGLEHGGWCPRGRRAENGAIPDRYALTETESGAYRMRNERNVLDSDATLIICRGRLSGGTRLTRQFARQHHKPYLIADLERSPNVEDVRAWLARHPVAVLNVAGPRESQSPGIAQQAAAFLKQTLR